MKSSGRKGDTEQAKFLALISPVKPVRVSSIVKDPRAVIAAQDQRATLVEVNQRSTVRKSIAEIASELST